MSLLNPNDNFAGAADDFYEALIAGHAGLGDDESAAMNARLILILANEVGDIARLREAIALARDTAEPAHTGERT